MKRIAGFLFAIVAAIVMFTSQQAVSQTTGAVVGYFPASGPTFTAAPAPGPTGLTNAYAYMTDEEGNQWSNPSGMLQSANVGSVYDSALIDSLASGSSTTTSTEVVCFALGSGYMGTMNRAITNTASAQGDISSAYDVGVSTTDIEINSVTNGGGSTQLGKETMTQTVGTSYCLKVDVTGTSPATITEKLFNGSTYAQIGSTLTATDSSGSINQTSSGYNGLRFYASDGTHGITRLQIWNTVQPDTVVANDATPAPTASPTATPTASPSATPSIAAVTVPLTNFTPVGSAGTTPAPGPAQFFVNGWEDYGGSTFYTVSGQLEEYSGSGFDNSIFSDDILGGGFSTNLLNSTTVVSFTCGTPDLNIFARLTPPYTGGVGRTDYRIGVNNSGTSSANLFIADDNVNVGGNGSTYTALASSSTFSTTVGSVYQLKADVYGSNPTTIVAKLYSSTNALVASLSYTDTGNVGPQGPGWTGVGFYAPDGTHGINQIAVWSQVQVDSQAYSPVAAATPLAVPSATAAPTCSSSCSATPAPSPSIAAAVTPIPSQAPGAVAGSNGAIGWLTTSNTVSAAAPIATALAAGTAGADTMVTVSATQNQPVDGMGTLVQYWAGFQTFKSMPLALQGPMMQALFAQTNGVMQLDMLRIALGQGKPFYTYDDQIGNTTDTSFSGFSLTPDDNLGLTAFLQNAVNLAPNLKILASPGTLPGWAKSPQSPYGQYQGANAVLNVSATVAAQYYVKFVAAELARGIPIWGLTWQNEGNGAYSADASTYTTEAQYAAGVTALCSALSAAGYGSVKVIGLDDFWSYYSEANQLITDTSSTCMAGIGFHWYGGTESTALTSVNTTHPGTATWMTEGQAFQNNGSITDSLSNFMPLIMTDFNMGGRGWLWFGMLATPINGEPSLSTYTADGLFNLNAFTGAATITPEGAITASFNHAVESGAYRLTSSSSNANVLATAFVNPDTNATRAVMLYNSDSTSHVVAISDASGYAFKYTLAAGAAAVFKYGNLSGVTPSTGQPVRAYRRY